MQSIEMTIQPKNRKVIPPFIGIGGTNEKHNKNCNFNAYVGTVPIYTEYDIHQFSELMIGFDLFIILRTEDGNQYNNLEEFYENGNKEKLLKE